MSAVAARLADGRLHLQHGPIDLIIEAFGAAAEVERAYGQAIERFGDILPTLVRELPTLRRPVGDAYPLLQGPVARRMAEAVWPHRAVYITPMAAVAGAVADEMLQALVRGRTLDKAYVNDGGDIALHLTPGHELRAGIFADRARRRGAPHPRPAGARHRHLGPRRPLVLAGHRRFGDRAGGDRRCRRRRGDPDRQCGERRSPRHRAPAGARARSRQRPRRSAGDGRGRTAAGCGRSARRWTAVPRKRGGCGSAA